MGATIETLLKEYRIGNFHSHNVLCGVIFTTNIAEKVEDMAMRNTTKGKVGSEHDKILVQSLPQVLRMVPNR